MISKEIQDYYDSLNIAEARRFNLLVTVGVKLGKPIEGAYIYAKTIMEEESGS